MARILVLNDEPELLEVIAMALEDCGHSVTTISTGEEMLETARRFNPHMVLLDWVMPGMQGDQVVRLLRKSYDSKVPIVLMTASEDGEGKARLIGANGFLQKPFDADQLRKSVTRVLDGANDRPTREHRE